MFGIVVRFVTKLTQHIGSRLGVALIDVGWWCPQWEVGFVVLLEWSPLLRNEPLDRGLVPIFFRVIGSERWVVWGSFTFEKTFMFNQCNMKLFKSHRRSMISNSNANIFVLFSKAMKTMKLKIIIINMNNIDKSQLIHYALNHMHVFTDGFVSFGC